MDSKTLIDKNYQNRGIDGLLVGLLNRCIQVEEVTLKLRWICGFQVSERVYVCKGLEELDKL